MSDARSVPFDPQAATGSAEAMRASALAARDMCALIDKRLHRPLQEVRLSGVFLVASTLPAVHQDVTQMRSDLASLGNLLRDAVAEDKRAQVR